MFNQDMFKAMTIFALRTELSDLYAIQKGLPSLFYGGFLNKHKRPPTKEEVDAEITRLEQELREAQDDARAN